MLRFLVFATIVLLGAQSVYAQTDVTHYSLAISGIGRIDYGMTYQAIGTVTGLTPGAIVQKHSISNDAISAQVTGISFKGADQIDSYAFAASGGGDVATVTAKIGDGTGASASVSNFQMFGYLTDNYAYVGQYADQMKGNSIDLEAQSYNKNDVTVPIDVQVGANGYYIYTTPTPTAGLEMPVAGYYLPGPTQVDAALPTTGLTVPGANVEHTEASSSIQTPAGTSTFTKVYQWAQAGGSATPEDYQNGMWSQAIIGKGSQINMKQGDAGDAIKVNNWAEYEDGTGNYMVSSPAEIPLMLELTCEAGSGTLAVTTNSDTIPSMLELTSQSAPGTLTATTNSDNMGYADKKILYANLDTALTVSGLLGYVGANNYHSDSHQQGVTTTTPTSSLVSNDGPFVGTENMFLYSLINSANPSGISRAVFY